MRIDIAALFPDICAAVLNTSITGRAIKEGKARLFCHQLRDYTENRQKQTDGYPYGGGPGKVMFVQPIISCYEHVLEELNPQGSIRSADESLDTVRPHVILLTPSGKPFTQADAVRLSQEENLFIICGHYEGIDERTSVLLEAEEISIGDYVLTGGELAACVVADSILRLLPGVLSAPENYEDESFWNGLLEYPQYARPAEYRGLKVPEVLLSGDHEKIRKWRQEKSLEKTQRVRPDLFENHKKAPF